MTGETWPSETRHFRCPEGSVYVIIAQKDGTPYYVDVRVSRAGGSPVAAAANALGILVGSSLRSGAGIAKLKTYLRGISVVSQEAVDAGEFDALSMPDAVGRTLEAYVA